MKILPLVLVGALTATGAALAQTIPPLDSAQAAAAIQKRERVARTSQVMCPIKVSKIVTSGAWAFVDAGCGPAEAAIVLAVFHYNNGGWNFACSHHNQSVMTANKAAAKCGMTHAQAVSFGFPDNP